MDSAVCSAELWQSKCDEIIAHMKRLRKKIRQNRAQPRNAATRKKTEDEDVMMIEKHLQVMEKVDQILDGMDELKNMTHDTQPMVEGNDYDSDATIDIDDDEQLQPMQEDSQLVQSLEITQSEGSQSKTTTEPCQTITQNNEAEPKAEDYQSMATEFSFPYEEQVNIVKYPAHAKAHENGKSQARLSFIF